MSEPVKDFALQPAQVYLHDLPAHLAPRDFQGIPGVACTAAGTLWAIWYGGGKGEGPDNYIMVANLNPKTEKWTEPWLVIRHDHPNVRAFDPVPWVDPLNRLWLFWSQGFSEKVGQIWDGRCGVWGICCEKPDEQPEQWSAPRRFCDGIMMNKPTLDEQGNWLMPSSIWQREPYHPAREGKPRGPSVAISTDQGLSAQLQGAAYVPDPIYDEHHIIPLDDGRWSLWARTKAMGRVAAVSYSSDRGKTWTPGQYSNIPCPNSRFYIGRLPSGSLLLVSHQITDEVRTKPTTSPPRSHLTAWVSDDQGQTWLGQLLIDERTQVSYPDVAVAPDGTIHIIYDYQRYAQRAILLASVTEQQIRDGKPEVKIQVVNQPAE